jgi:hypothetical protein
MPTYRLHYFPESGNSSPITATWFETRGVAALLTMRVQTSS